MRLSEGEYYAELTRLLGMELPEDVAASRKMAKRHCSMYFGYHIVRLNDAYQKKRR